jgi:muconolactone delta-isomerase
MLNGTDWKYLGLFFYSRNECVHDLIHELGSFTYHAIDIAHPTVPHRHNPSNPMHTRSH